MSAKHPIVGLTGSSGAGTTSTGRTLKSILDEAGIVPVVVEGDSFHRYTRAEMTAIAAQGRFGSANHFSLESNHIDKLEELFIQYGLQGTGRFRNYVHNDDLELIDAGHPPGTFTEWDPIAPGSDCLFYEGLHGGLVVPGYNVARHVDLLIGVAPIVNLEWIQKIHRDTHRRGYSEEAVVSTIVNRMEDYVRYIVPQFANTHINIQRVPTVDTSNPFIVREVPTHEECFVIIRFRDYRQVNLLWLQNSICGAFSSRRDTLVIPGNQLPVAINLIIKPWVLDLVEKARLLRS
jgi:phosphoribulokinase